MERSGIRAAIGWRNFPLGLPERFAVPPPLITRSNHVRRSEQPHDGAAVDPARDHGEPANRILGQGSTVKTEMLSYKAWQRQRYGKSLKVRAPGMFVRMLERKAATGGELIEFGTRNTCLSQFCHVDVTYEKKPLRQRYHQFPDVAPFGACRVAAVLDRTDGITERLATEGLVMVQDEIPRILVLFATAKSMASLSRS
jgi:hypothetical protein